jgi:hypothetical protein
MSLAYRHDDCTSEQAVPRIIWVVVVIVIKKNRPLITGCVKAATTQTLARSARISSIANSKNMGRTRDPSSLIRQDKEEIRCDRD